MSKEYSWAEVRERAVESFGGRYPDAELEQEIVDLFRERPAFVVACIEDVAGGYKAGRINSPWPFLRKRVVEAPPVDAVVTDGSERDRKVAAAQKWMHNAGLYVGSVDELVDALFGGSGRLAAYAGDAALRDEMVALWTKLAPAGVAAEREAAERLIAQVASLERARELVSKREPFAGFVRPSENGRAGVAVADWVGEEPPLADGVAPG